MPTPYERAFGLIERTCGKPRARRLAAVALRTSAVLHPAVPPATLRRHVMGLSFPSPLGLAAGFDKSGALYPALSALGLGFAEIGSVTPQPETGRSPGLDAVVARLQGRPRTIPLGVSISMNRDTPWTLMARDYVAGLRAVWPHADYVTINLGVRAGPDLHQPQHAAVLRQVLTAVKNTQAQLARDYGYRRPLAVKLDSRRGDGAALLDCVSAFEFDGLVLVDYGRTTAEGELLLERAARRLPPATALIAAGGIDTPQQAETRLRAGAALLQLFSGLVARGPGLIRAMHDHLA